ncbi:MAG: chemotaxis protein CheA [Planctomycetota bacterium]|jgi:two-component system chemotaxis sensor kinase CheA
MSDDLLTEFLEESHEHLARLEVDLVALESDAGNPELLASAYRALHTLKGNCGFLALPRLERMAHAAESLLAKLRDDELELTPQRTSLLLRGIDEIRAQLDAIGEQGGETEGDDAALITALEKGEPLAPAPKPIPDSRVEAHTVRIDVDLLDDMMGLVGELVLMRNRVMRDEDGRAARHELDRITSLLQDRVMRARMDPVGRLFDRIPRLVRDLAAELGKEVELRTAGSETELDRSILESFADPLTHLLRNAIDHGIERKGTVTLAAYQAGSQVVLEVRDDGRGIDVEALRRKAEEAGLPPCEDPTEYAFEPGLSTAEEITRVSGRGVGMDVVRENVERLGGTIELLTARGAGTTVRIRLPLTLAIIPGIVVRCGGQEFVIPQRHVREMFRVGSHDAFERIGGKPVYRLRGRVLPVVFLGEQLGLHAEGRGAALAVVEADGRRYGLVIDRILDTQEVVVKPLSELLASLPFYGGATTLSSGEVALLLEAAGIAKHAGVEPTDELIPEPALPVEEGSTRLLLAEDLGGRRVLLPLDRVERIEEVWAESLLGKTAHWRGEELPLRFLGDVKGARETERVFLAIVQAGGGRHALALSRVRDVVRTTATGPTLLVRGRAAALVDLEEE